MVKDMDKVHTEVMAVNIRVNSVANIQGEGQGLVTEGLVHLMANRTELANIMAVVNNMAAANNTAVHNTEVRPTVVHPTTNLAAAALADFKDLCSTRLAIKIL